jgi:prepilin-type N-terminal cleavage/methylation domain-containing protein
MKFLKSAGTNRAFTLIELLVVIAIIGILAALLMPSLVRAKNQASKVTDLNNLKQIMVALHVYTADAGDVLPPPNWDNGGFNGANGNGTFAGWLYKPDLSASGTDRFVMSGGVFWPLLHSAKIYVCPGDNLQMFHFSNNDQANVQRQQQLSTYAMNGAVIGFMRMSYPPVRLSQLRPTDCAFWETDETEPYYFNDGANYPPEGVSGRHSQGGIQAAFDSSVSYVKLVNWYQDVTETNRNRLWCYPNSPDGR